MTILPHELALRFFFAAALLAGCKDPDGGAPLVEVDPPSTMLSESGDDSGSSGDMACEPIDLCTRTIDECAIDLPLDDCAGWYADASNCADMAGYLACNCECLSEATCDDYFSCGEICFEDLCGG